MTRRWTLILPAATLLLLITAAPALACGGLIGPNGAVNLLRTTTFAGYHAGEEHYITSFEYAGGGGAFGSLTPLPGIPSSVEKGGDWTLQRLIRETDPPAFRVSADATLSAAGEAQEILKVRIDALDITVLKGGAAEVGKWATDHGFRLPPDAPEVLEFYASRSPIFLAAAFDPTAAAERGQNLGDGTPVHVTIPTDNPWVPLRILGLGKVGEETVQADVYLLTDIRPALMPQARGFNGISVTHGRWANDLLLDDLRSDRGMEWVPKKAWLTKVEVNASADQLKYDLAIDASGKGRPSAVAAGFTNATGRDDAILIVDGTRDSRALAGIVIMIAGIGLIGLLLTSRPAGARVAPEPVDPKP